MASTTNFKFPLPDFDKRLWHEDFYRTIRTVDAVLAQYIAVNNIVGVWDNGVAYAVGERVIDGDVGLVYDCLVAHTSPASPTTFASSRTTNPSYWQTFGAIDRIKGEWTTATAYVVSDYVYYGHVYARCSVTHTSGATFVGDAANWAYLIDADATVAATLAAQAAAELAETNAETAETNAAASAVTATNQATIATTQAGIATTQATNAANSALATAADAISTAADVVATNADVVSTAADVLAAAASASAAAASYDSFDDRYLGAKAADPTLDNDGDPLIDGAMYYNSTANEMRVYDLGTTTWLTSYLPSAAYLAVADNLSDLANAATARTNIGLGTGNSPEFTAVNIGHASDTTITRTGAGDIAVEGNAIYRAGGTDVPVADGGTGASSLTAYAVLCGGTTSTGAVQPIASVGTAGQLLTSNGAGALPTFQTPAGGGDYEYYSTTPTTSGTYAQITGLDSAYDHIFVFDNVKPTGGDYLACQVGTGSTPTWVATGYNYAHVTISSGVALTKYSNSDTVSIVFCPDPRYVNATYGGVSGEVKAGNLSEGYTKVAYDLSYSAESSHNIDSVKGAGYYRGANTAITAIRFFFINLVALNGGAIRTYRRAKS